MDNLNELKKIWLSADTTALPDTAEMLQRISKYRSSKLVRKAGLVAAAVLLTGILVMVMFTYKSVMISTRAGECLMAAAGLLLVLTNIKSLGRLYRVKDCSNKEFIEYLEQVQRNRAYYHKNTQVAGLALVSAGLLLYIYEAVHASFYLCLGAYAFTITYILVAWLVIRPRAYKRQAKKLQETMKKMADLSKQF